MARDFDIGDVLSITTERLVSPTHMDGVYAILNYLTNDNLYTHQLPRACDECKPYLLKQFPFLRDIVVPIKFDGLQHVTDWVNYHAEIYGRTLTVVAIPNDNHEVKDPMTELQELTNNRPIIGVVI